MLKHVDLYEYAYQTISKQIVKNNPYIDKSGLRRMTIEEIRRKLRFRIAFEDVDSNDFRKWSAAKKLNWLQDLQEFVCKTLGKRRYIQLRDRRNSF